MTEKRLQQECFTWFHNNFPALRGSLWMNHNQAVNRKQGAILKAMGMVAGVSDLLWINKGHLHGIELKTPEGRQSDVQKRWSEALTTAGGSYHIIRTLEEFKQLINGKLHARG